MQITINAYQTQLNHETSLRMKRRLSSALNRFYHAINRVRVRLTDINGPKSGPDKHCLVVVKLREGGEIVIQGKGVDSGSALSHCANRISHAVDRALVRRRKTPIRKMHRIRNAEWVAALEHEEKINLTIEQDSMSMGLQDFLALTNDGTEQKMRFQFKKKSRGALPVP